MALRAPAELLAVGVQTGLDDVPFAALVATVDGLITDYVTGHTPEADRAAILDSASAAVAQLQLVRLLLTDTSLREWQAGDVRFSARSLRFEIPPDPPTASDTSSKHDRRMTWPT